MAKFGVQGIRYLNLARSAGTGAASDLTYTSNGAGHDRAFYWVSTRCRETSIRGADHAGSDRGWVHDVALLRSRLMAIMKPTARHECPTTYRGPVPACDTTSPEGIVRC